MASLKLWSALGGLLFLLSFGGAAEQPAKVDASALTLEQRHQLLNELLNTQSAADKRIKYLLESSKNPFSLLPYEQNYILYSLSSDIDKEPYLESFGDEAQKLENHETKFQLSLMFPIWRGILGDNSALMASYTQVSYWQALNSDISAPFRETNYEPQLFLGWLTDIDILGFKLRWIEAGINHQSNGRGEPLSRSWNRIFANFMFQRENLSINFKPYIRIQESAEEDDNPNIEDYLGRHRLDFAYRYGREGKNVLTLRTRYSFSGHRGSAELGLSRQITPNVRLYAQLFSGYGESMIEYQHEQTRLGVGFMLNDLL